MRATVGGTKVTGTEGGGELHVRKGLRRQRRVFGGTQGRMVRAGTGGLPRVGAFAEAVRCLRVSGQTIGPIEALNRYLREGLLKIPGTAVHSPDDAIPYVLGFSAGRVKAQTMLNFLSERGVYVSSGSACDKGKQSHVLESMGLSRAQMDSALRVSFSHFSTKEDVDALLAGMREGLSTLTHS
mgnify:CR=1 FL=1